MSGVTRDGRISKLSDALLWRLDLGSDPKFSDARLKADARALIMEPYTNGSVTQLNAWVEARRDRFIYIVDEPDQRPTEERAQRYTAIEEVWESKVHGCSGMSGMDFIVVRALCTNELVGDSAKEVMHSLFWRVFVDNDDGLEYLCRFASKEVGDFYARSRLQSLTEGRRKTNPVVGAIVNATSTYAPLMGLRAWQRAQVDRAFFDAIDALRTTGDPDGVRDQTISKFIHTQLGQAA